MYNFVINWFINKPKFGSSAFTDSLFEIILINKVLIKKKEMLTSYINHDNKNVCSIEQLNQEFQKQQLLLSSYKKNDTIMQEEQDELFSLYITPYSDKDMKGIRHRDHSINQDTTILKGSQKEESLLQTKCQQLQEEVKRLKRIIFKKNQVIGQLTEELKICYQQSKKRSNARRSSNHQYNSQLCSQGKYCKESKQNQCLHCKCKSQLTFFQANNLKLYEQMNNYKTNFQRLSKDFARLNQIYQRQKPKLELALTQNQSLKKENANLLISTKKYINQGSKQIKIVNKMREVLAEKLSLKQMNIQIPEFNSRSISKNASTIRLEKEKKTTESVQLSKSFKSLEKSKDRITKERSYSYDSKKGKN